MSDDRLWTLVLVLVPLSLVSFGGSPSIFAGLQHAAVDMHKWVTGREFLESFGISRIAPGPGSMVVTLLGWKLAGWTGAVVATLALYVPASALCYGVTRLWNHHRGSPWHEILERAFTPIGAGLVLAGALSIIRIAHADYPMLFVTLVCAGVALARPRMHPLFVLVGGGIAFVLLRCVVPT